MSVLSNTGIRMGASAAGGGGTKYVEEVFSTDLYTGNATAEANRQSINNGIDLAGEGGMVWLKSRSNATYHELADTERGTNGSTGNAIHANNDHSEGAGELVSFDDDGFTLGYNTADGNYDGRTYASWTFRKAKGFFDVVTWTGSGTTDTDHRISHSLGCVPGCILVKKTDGTQDWRVYHKEVGVDSYQALNNSSAFTSGFNCFGSAPTSTDFGINEDNLSMSSGNFVAYLFADGDEAAAQIFGEDGDESIIKCGTLNRTSAGTSGDVEIECGWEPQWILVKSSSDADSWRMYDTMRGMGDSTGGTRRLYPDTAGAENGHEECIVRSTGFTSISGPAHNMIYVAIRRGPMKTPEDATKVFAIDIGSTAEPAFDSGFTVDAAIRHPTYTSAGNNPRMYSRLQGTKHLYTSGSYDEGTEANSVWDSNAGFYKSDSTNAFAWMFRRAPGFMDVVAYAGTGSAHTEAHNLGVVPELMIFKARDASENWAVYNKDLTSAGYHLLLNSSNGENTNSATWNSTDPTASVFTVGNDNYSNGSTENYIAYLFASCPGVSKVGSYNGSSSDIDVDCGFTSGARFVLIKRSDGNGDWCLYDTVRGIVSGSDSKLILNGTDAQDTGNDNIDPLSSGFTVVGGNTHVNNSSAGAKYIFLAIA